MPRLTLKQRKDGRYVCAYKDMRFYGLTQAEAIDKRERYIDDIKRGLREQAGTRPVADYAAEWMGTYKAHVTRKTYNAYLGYINTILAECGDKRVQDVTTSDIQRIYNRRKDNGGDSIKKQAMITKSLFESAQADGLILRNPCIKAKRPAGYEGTHRSIEQWERDIIHQMARTNHRLASAVMVMLYAGLRRGEMLAINIDRDVDFDARTITVREAVRYEHNRPIICDPKSEAGKRVVPMPDILADVLRDKHGLIVCTHEGKHMTLGVFVSTWRSYLYHCAVTLNGGKRKRWLDRTKADKLKHAQGAKSDAWREFSIRTHDLRHSYCTMLYEADIDLKSAQKWMGHADEKMILKIYAHLTEKHEQKAAEKLHHALANIQIGIQHND